MSRTRQGRMVRAGDYWLGRDGVAWRVVSVGELRSEAVIESMDGKRVDATHFSLRRQFTALGLVEAKQAIARGGQVVHIESLKHAAGRHAMDTERMLDVLTECEAPYVQRATGHYELDPDVVDAAVEAWKQRRARRAMGAR